MEFFLTLAYAILIAGWVALSRRAKRIERQLESAALSAASSSELIVQLRRRIEALEQAPATVQALVEAPVAVAPEPVAEPEVAPVYEELPPPLPIALPIEPEPETETAPPLPLPIPVPQAARQKIDFEAFVGGNLMIKLGVLVLVVGIALLLSWSLTELGPAGRIAVGLLTGLCLLASGVLTERREHYVTFGRGLIAGGWAALYFTVYAMHGVRAAQVIRDPLAGFTLLLVVAVAMVLHSLRYRSETLTALTFFVAFFTLNLFPATTFSLLAALPLTIFLLAVCWRYAWATAAVAGLTLTYGTLVFQWREESAVWNHSPLGIALLWTYWLLFEGYDLLSLWKGRERTDAFRTLFPLNACGFLFAATLPGSPIPKDNLTSFLIAASVAYLGSALLRARIAPSADEEDLRKEVFGGGYELAVTLSAGLMMASLGRQFHHLALTRAQLFEGELLTLAGVALRRRFLQYLGAAVLAIPAIKLLLIDSTLKDTFDVLGTTMHVWTPTALVAAALFYLNRGITRRLQPYSFVAGALVTTALALELNEQYYGLAWTLLALAQYQASRMTPLRELRWAALVNGIMGYFVLLTLNGLAEPVRSASIPILWIGSLLYYASAFQVYLQWRRGDESRAVRVAFRAITWAALPLLLLAIGRGFAGDWVVLGWTAAAIALCEAGMRGERGTLRWKGYVAMFCACGRLFFHTFESKEFIAGVSLWVWVGVPVAAACYWLAARLLRLRTAEMGTAGRVFTYAGALVLAVLLATRLPHYLGTVGLALFMAALVALGVRWAVADLRWQSYLLTFWVFGMTVSENLLVTDSPGWWSRWTLGALVVVILYHACQFAIPKNWTLGMAWETYARSGYSLFGTILLTALVGVRVSGSNVTVAWAVEAIGLLVLGFVLQERTFRLSGLVLFLFCVAKLFVFDLRNLETLAKIIAFIVLGLLLIGTSWAYTRFREQVKKML